MRISHKYKLIFVSVPKSGSHTGFKFMEEYLYAVPYGGYHETNIPEKYKDYTVFTFVRNPYERFCSLYHACVINDNKTFVPTYAKNSLLEYAKWYAEIARLHIYPRRDLCTPQWYWLKNLKNYESFHIETAELSIRQTNIPGLESMVFPHILKRNHPTWKDVKTPELTKYINLWAGKDFELFGYEKECE